MFINMDIVKGYVMTYPEGENTSLHNE